MVVLVIPLMLYSIFENAFGGINLFESLARRARFVWSASFPSSLLAVICIAALPVVLLSWLSYVQFARTEWEPITVTATR